MERLATRERGVHLHTLEDPMWKRYKNVDEGVVLAAIQIAEDPI